MVRPRDVGRQRKARGRPGVLDLAALVFEETVRGRLPRAFEWIDTLRSRQRPEARLNDRVGEIPPVAQDQPNPKALRAMAVRGPGQRLYLTLTTGPSRTADIERVLTIGVQGPRAVHLVVVGGGLG